MTRPAMSVVIPVYDNWWLTARCLRELERLRDGRSISFETIVVDNASTDETPSAIAAFPWVRYLRHDVNRNFAGACNAGARIAQAPVTFFLNNDAYPLGDALTPLLRVFDREVVTVAGGALFFEDSVTQAAGLVLLQNAHWHYYCRNLRAADVGMSRDALAVSGAAMAVRTQWFLASGGFDETYINGFEDVDLCMRARAQGRAIAYVADARFAHYEAASAGRFKREADNERLFYERWSSRLSALPRIARGEVGTIALHTFTENPLLQAALEDLAGALRDFGHPIVYGTIAAWRHFDRRFRRAANLAWFGDKSDAPGAAVRRNLDKLTVIQTFGAVDETEPWLPCASAERVARCGVRRSEDPSCTAVGVAGNDDEEAAFALPRRWPIVRITPEMLLGKERVDLACVVHFGLTDDAGFGTALLAQAGLPSVVLMKNELPTLFPPDVALLNERWSRGGLADSVARFVGDPTLRAHYGKLVAADARRRFSPRRSAIRVVDLLCAARFGLERPAPRRSNSPF